MIWMRIGMSRSPGPMLVVLLSVLFASLLCSSPEVLASKNSVERGRRIFNSQICRDCHRMQGRGGLAAPDLTGLWKKGKTRDYIIDHLRHPHKYDHFTIMPDFNFSPEDEQALADYLLSPK